MPVTLPIVNSTVCPDNLFTCDDGTCIPFTYRCDGKVGSNVYFYIIYEPVLILMIYSVCAMLLWANLLFFSFNFQSDCLSGSDEVGCKETSECGQDNDKQLMFMCKDGSCLRWSFVCDFITDCLPDGEDEQGCRKLLFSFLSLFCFSSHSRKYNSVNHSLLQTKNTSSLLNFYHLITVTLFIFRN